jgi:hypothetical protein
MPRSTALYRDDSLVPMPRASVQLDQDELVLGLADGAWRRVCLDGASVGVADAAYHRRFVRMLSVERGAERADLITPPDHGAIAPRVARLPLAPVDCAVVDDPVWEIVVDWVISGGRIAGRTVAELARLATIATPQFALVLGELAAQAAIDMVWEHAGPLRGGADVVHSLLPLHEAARTSVRAADALVAALSVCAAVRMAYGRRRLP